MNVKTASAVFTISTQGTRATEALPPDSVSIVCLYHEPDGRNLADSPPPPPPQAHHQAHHQANYSTQFFIFIHAPSLHLSLCRPFIDACVCLFLCVCVVDCRFVCSLSCAVYWTRIHTGKCTLLIQLLLLHYRSVSDWFFLIICLVAGYFFITPLPTTCR